MARRSQRNVAPHANDPLLRQAIDVGDDWKISDPEDCQMLAWDYPWDKFEDPEKQMWVLLTVCGPDFEEQGVWTYDITLEQGEVGQGLDDESTESWDEAKRVIRLYRKRVAETRKSMARNANPRADWVVIAAENRWQWPVAPIEVVSRHEAIDRTNRSPRAMAIRGFGDRAEATDYALAVEHTEVEITTPQGDVVYRGPLLGFSDTDTASRRPFVDRGRLFALVEQNETQLGRAKKSLVARRTDRVTEYRVAYLGQGARRTYVEGTFSLEQAQQGVRSLKRRGMAPWVETTDGEFVPVKGAKKRPKSREDNARRKQNNEVELVDAETGAVEWRGSVAEFIDAQDVEVWSDAERRALRGLARRGGPDGYYFGGGASPWMLIRRADLKDGEYFDLGSVDDPRAKRNANALARGEV